MGKTVCHQIPSCNLTSLGGNSASLDNLKSICLFWKWWFSSSQTVPSSLLSSDVVAGPWEVGPLGLRRRSLTKDSVFFGQKNGLDNRFDDHVLFFFHHCMQVYGLFHWLFMAIYPLLMAILWPVKSVKQWKIKGNMLIDYSNLGCHVNLGSRCVFDLYGIYYAAQEWVLLWDTCPKLAMVMSITNPKWSHREISPAEI